jgi:hypothetical protein
MSRTLIVIGFFFDSAAQAVLASQVDRGSVAAAALVVALSALPGAYLLAHRCFDRLANTPAGDVLGDGCEGLHRNN